MKKMEFEQFYNLEYMTPFYGYSKTKIEISLKMIDFKRFVKENSSLIKVFDRKKNSMIYYTEDFDANSSSDWKYVLGCEVGGFETSSVCCIDDVIVIPFDERVEDAKIKYTKLFNLLKDKYNATFSMVEKFCRCT